MFQLGIGPEGATLFHFADYEPSRRIVAAVVADARIDSPVWVVGNRPLIVENRLALDVRPNQHVDWPWPDQSPAEVLAPLRESIVGMMRLPTPRLQPGWWDVPQRTILWREIALTAASWLGWPLLAVGLYVVVRRSPTERAFAKLRDRGICPNCDYDLTGARDRCPECGRPIAPDEQAVIPT